MKPEERPREAERIGGEVSDIVEAIRGKAPQQPETKWQDGIARNPWALIGLSSLLLLSVGTLYGQNGGRDAREHDQFRAAIVALQQWQTDVKSENARDQMRLNQFAAIAQQALNGINDLKEEQYRHYRAAAIARGDDAAEKRLDVKLKALADSKAGGSGGTP